MHIFHKWQEVKDNGFITYYECVTCGKRKFKQRGGYSPVDWAWLHGSKHRTEDLLLSLLTIIHRDGGHYTDRYGIEKSYDDAVKKCYELRRKVDV